MGQIEEGSQNLWFHSFFFGYNLFMSSSASTLQHDNFINIIGSDIYILHWLKGSFGDT